MNIKITRILIKMVAVTMMLVLLSVLAGKSCGFFTDAAGGPRNTGEQVEVVRLNRRNMEVPVYYLPDDGTNMDSVNPGQDSEKKKARIQFSHLIFLNGIFYNLLYPMLLFFILIRLFGRNLYVLWHVISYIHVRDDGEYYLIPVLHSGNSIRIYETIF